MMEHFHINMLKVMVFFVQMLKEKGIAVYSENEVTEVLKLINGGK